jgi:transposase
MFGPGGQVLLDKMDLPQPYRYRVDSLRRLVEVFDDEIDVAESQVHKRLKGHRGYHAIQALHGVGRVTAAIFVAEIGDISRFTSARHLCSWAGLTPSHRESDDKAHRGHITKQGSTLVRSPPPRRWPATTAGRLSRRRSGGSSNAAAPWSPGWRQPAGY